MTTQQEPALCAPSPPGLRLNACAVVGPDGDLPVDPLVVWGHEYPELKLFTATEDRMQAWHVATRRAFQPAVCIALCAALFLGTLLAGLVGGGWDGVARMIVPAGVVTAAGAWLYGWLVMPLLAGRAISQSLRRSLNGYGIPICIGCGYDLTGNTSGTCAERGSECGVRAAS